MKLFGESETFGVGDDSQAGSALLQVKLNLTAVKQIVAFASAKGGVGKSAIVTNVAAALAIAGRKVGLLDADLNSPSVAAMLGMKRASLFPTGDEIDPAAGPLGLRVVASNLLAESEPPPLDLLEEEPSPSSNGARPVELTRPQMIHRLFANTRFGALDFLLIDLAPGLGDLELVAKIAPLTGIVLVTHPTHLGAVALKAAVELAAHASTPLTGIVENMTAFYCESCHSMRPMLPQGDMAAVLRGKGPAVIGRLSFDPRLAAACDRGAIFVKEHADSPLAKQIGEVSARLGESLAAHTRPQV
jgi:ATP-binding protein involved in chromosome partitioning